MLIGARLCPSLSEPSNGMISCSLGSDGDATYKDTCSYTCNTGYKLTGSDTRTCQSDGSWSGTDGSCGRGMWLCVCTSIIIVYLRMITNCESEVILNYYYNSSMSIIN